MKQHKMTVLLALVLVFALMLAGCGSSADPSGKVEAAPAPIATEAPAENPLSLGRISGGSYTNKYAGFGCNLDDSWTFYSAEELQELPESVKEALEGSEISEGLEDLEQITDVMAENEALLSNFNVLYTKSDMKSRLAYQLMSDEDLVDGVLTQKDALISSYAQAGIEVKTMEKAQVSFLGKEQWAIKTTAQTQGVDCFMVQVFNYKAGAYGITATFTSFIEDNTQTVMDLFYAVD